LEKYPKTSKYTVVNSTTIKAKPNNALEDFNKQTKTSSNKDQICAICKRKE